MKWAAGILAAGLTVLAIGTLVARHRPKGEIPVPAIDSAKVLGGLCPEGESLGHAEVSIRVPGGVDDDESLHAGIKGGEGTSYHDAGVENHLFLGFTANALANSEIEVTATMTRFDPGDAFEQSRTVAKRISCEEIVFRLPSRVPDRVVRDCRRRLAMDENRICELAILRSEGKVKPGPYTERELSAAIR